MNLDSTFTRRDGSEMSFRVYYTDKAKKMDLGVVEIKDERFLVEYDGKFYLPQFLWLCANNKIQTDYTRKQVREKYSNPKASTVIEESLILNSTLNQTAAKMKKVFSTDIKKDENDIRRLIPKTVLAYDLNEPMAKLIGGTVPATKLNGKNWGQTIKGVVGPPFQQTQQQSHSSRSSRSSHVNVECYQALDWCIIYQQNMHKSNAYKIQESFGRFISKRNFNPRPLNEPDMWAADFRDLGYMRHLCLHGNKKYCVAVIVINDDKTGSKQKIDLTRYLNFHEKPRYTLTQGDNYQVNSDYIDSPQYDGNGDRKYKVDTQFITASQCFQSFSVFGAIEGTSFVWCIF